MISETKALEKLHEIKKDFARRIRDDYEHRAKSCLSCETKGACCQDAHFVNVRITRLEAVAIRRVIDELPEKDDLMARVESAITRYGLSDGEGFYSCPLFEKGVGCLVHERGKPLPCITHACYENKEDLPPDELIMKQELEIDRLSRTVYRKPTVWVPLPVAISKVR